MQTKRVALLFHRDLAFCRGVLKGIESWLNESGAGWHVRHAPSTPDVLPSLWEWAPDGVLGHVFDADLAADLQRWQGPWVNTTLTLPDLTVPTVDAHHRAIGRMAAEYLLQRGHRSFGFFGNPWALFSKQREQGFRRRLKQAGYELQVAYAEYLPMRPAQSSWVRIDTELEDWLQKLSKPAAVFCCHDVPARDLIEVCTSIGLRVPEDLAILGVDNDRFECEIARPTLSSVSLQLGEIGRTAAAMLQRQMKGQAVRQRPLLIEPNQVVTRRSTDSLAVEDRAVRKALDFLQASVQEPIAVTDVARAVGLSRRQLERSFRDALGRTVLSEIHRLRLDRALKLLRETDWKIEVVAYRAGFSGSRQMAEIFRRQFGRPPREFRT
jgi:LacI family transcriptional regulator, galactose operon repressor